MIDGLAWGLIVASVVLALWCLVGAIRKARPSLYQLVAALVLWVGFLVQALIGIVLMLRRTEPLESFVFVGYHLTALAVLLGGAFWGIADRSRWGNGVFAIACATEVVLVIRLMQIWGAGA